jgi:uncharacterized protein (TIGR03437 family)
VSARAGDPLTDVNSIAAWLVLSEYHVKLQSMHRLLAVLALAAFVPAAFPAESGGPSNYPAAAPAEVVRMLFRSPNAFHVAQAATVPISVAHGASFIPLTSSGFALAPNTFGSIFGTVAEGGGRLLPEGPAKDWGNDFQNGVGPTSLNGVRVLVNGKEAFLAFVGRAEQINSALDQINFLAPDDDALGPVSLEVFIGQDRVSASMVNLGPLSPGLFAFAPAEGSGVQYVVAHTPSTEAFPRGQFLLPPGFFPGLDTRPAKSDELIIIYGTGFGETEPSVPVGQIPAIGSAIPGGVQVRIGGLPANTEYAGLAPCCAGLFQFNVRVPQLSNGNHTVTVERSGVSSQAGLSLIIQND